MQDWFAKHPGGQHAICEPVKIIRGKTREVGVPLTRTEAHDHFKRTLANSKWYKIRGFHVFRHTFASQPWPPPAWISGSSTNGWGTRRKRCGNATGTCCPISSRPRST